MNFLKVQYNDLANRLAPVIVGPVLGKFTHIAAVGVESVPGKFAALLDHAKSEGLGFLWWFTPGYWNRMSLKEQYDIKFVWPNAPRSWPYFALQDVKDHTVRHMLNVLASHPGIDGVLVDYLRYPPDIIAKHPDLFSADDIIDTLAELRVAQRQHFPDLHFIGNVGRDHGSKRKGQYWDDWLRRDLIDSVNVRCYLEPHRLATQLANNVAVVDIERQSICYAPGGYSGHDPLTQVQINQYIQIASDAGYTGDLDVFDWQHVEATGRWDMIPELQDPPDPPDPPDPTTIAGTYEASYHGPGFNFEGGELRIGRKLD